MYEFYIQDMTCGHCVATVQKAITAIDQAAEVAIDLSVKKAKVSTAVDPAKISAAIEEAGYKSSFVEV